MGNIYSKAIAIGREADARDISICRRHNLFTLTSIGLNIDARMEVVGAHLGKRCRVEPFNTLYRVVICKNGA